MDLKRAFGVDKESAEQGKWFNLREDGRVKVARLNNPSFIAEVARLQKPHLAKIRNPHLNTSDIMIDITITATARTILVDWEDISIDGEEIPYSSEKAVELFNDYPDFLEAVSLIATEKDNYSLEDIAEK